VIDNFPGSAMTVLDCLYVCENMRDEDFEEFNLRQPGIDKEEIIKEILNRNGEEFTVRNKINDPIIIGGAFYDTPGVATLWFIATSKIKNRDWGQLVCLTSILIEVMFLNHSCHRVQAYVRENRKNGHSWMKHIGLEKEGCLNSYFSNGENCFIYGKVR
jgi:hypothetical protein